MMPLSEPLPSIGDMPSATTGRDLKIRSFSSIRIAAGGPPQHLLPLDLHYSCR